MKIKALLFDFDETLLVNEESTRSSIRFAWEIYQKNFPDITPETIVNVYMDTRDKFWHRSDKLVMPFIQQCMRKVRYHLWKLTLESLNINQLDIIEILVDRFGQKRFETWQLYPDSLVILDQLKNSYKLVMITNGVPEVQWAKIKKVNVESYFYPILISGELGISKPDPHIFYQALNKIHLNKNEAIVIGDSVRNDISGARNAGMLSIWVNRNDILPHPTILPDYEIKSLYELPQVLISLE